MTVQVICGRTGPTIIKGILYGEEAVKSKLDGDETAKAIAANRQRDTDHAAHAALLSAVPFSVAAITMVVWHRRPICMLPCLAGRPAWHPQCHFTCSPCIAPHDNAHLLTLAECSLDVYSNPRRWPEAVHIHVRKSHIHACRRFCARALTVVIMIMIVQTSS